ncbi:GntR family transcriptional regulator [Luethyella okanaganae]|uniref:GntR family transcriptional regulator n=1 Tax=Luethyella okanaganae TaxID=69372 RepID=A0ABW1VH07_9MICO
MLFRIDHSLPQTLSAQVADQVRTGLLDGDILPGERLPPARDLSVALGVTIHTVLRAYAKLRDDRIVDMRQGRGAWIRDDSPMVHAEIAGLVEKLLDTARRAGITRQDLARLVEQRV